MKFEAKDLNKLNKSSNLDEFEDKATLEGNVGSPFLVYEQNLQSKVFAFVISIQIGSRNETIDNNGISHLVEHLIFKRSAKRSAKGIANKMEDLGAIANAFTTKEQTVFYLRGLDRNFTKILDLLFEIVFDSKFIEKELEKEKEIIIDEITSYEDDAEETIYEQAESLLFRDNALALPIGGTVKTVTRLSYQVTKDFYIKNYQQGVSVIFSYIGSFSKKEVQKVVDKKLNKFNVQANKNFSFSEEDSQSQIETQQFNITEKKEFSQSHLLALKSFPITSEINKITLAIINLIFGDSMSSRLNYRFREANPISYSVYSSLQLYSDNIVFYIYISMDKAKLKKSAALLKQEIIKLNLEGVTEKELHRAKEQYRTALLLEQESVTDRTINLIKIKSQKEENISINNLEERLARINLLHINQFCKEFFDYSSFSFLQYK